jgi:protein involved in polysaccharide export with SLBB domain
MKPHDHCGARDFGVCTCLAGVLSAVLLASSTPALSESTESIMIGKPVEPTQEARDPAAFEFAVGDRLSIRLFERYKSDDGTGTAASLIEIPEVSGEYVVQENGTIFLPFLGELSFAGQSQQALREEVSQRFQRIHGRSVEFTVRIVERDPVYVTGAVTSPGAYRHVPAMTVLHALTLAGSLLGTGGDVWRRFDLGRERERLRQTELTLARLDAKSAVLEAEAANREPNPPASLVAMVGQDRARKLLQEALHMRTLERQQARAEDKAHKLIIDKLEAELSVMKEALAEAEKTIAVRAKRVESIADLHGKGLANETTYNMVGDALSDARKNWHEMRMAFASVQRSLVEAQQVRQRLVLDDLLERERERAELKAQIADHKATRETITQMLLGANDYPSAPSDGNVKIIVLRRSVDGLDEIQLDEHALLKPGDLIEIRATPQEHALLPSQNPLRPIVKQSSER